MNSNIVIKSFRPEDQVEVKRLILSGLAEHWGVLDPSMNPDLNDIGVTYAKATFLVAWLGDRIVGAGALVPHSRRTAEIVRMSVAKDMRRQGIGGVILKQLLSNAQAGRFKKVTLETNSNWQAALAFYQQHGFRITHYQGDEVHFVLDLSG